jgi:RNA polymerase subunit RPABC4/transcription elongation factor Spt4
MALYACKSCGNGCGQHAKACPHCGEPDPVDPWAGVPWRIRIILAAIIIVVFGLFVRMLENS